MILGDRVEIETIDGWGPGIVDGVSCPGIGPCARIDEPFGRLNVRAEDGRYWRGAHPDCVRLVEPTESVQLVLEVGAAA